MPPTAVRFPGAVGRDEADVGAGLTLARGSKLSLSAGIEADFAGRAMRQSASLGLRLQV